MSLINSRGVKNACGTAQPTALMRARGRERGLLQVSLCYKEWQQWRHTHIEHVLSPSKIYKFVAWQRQEHLKKSMNHFEDNLVNPIQDLLHFRKVQELSEGNHLHQPGQWHPLHLHPDTYNTCSLKDVLSI